MIKRISFGALLTLSIFLYSCYPQGAETLDDTNLVFTDHDDQFDFASERTYHLVPEVIYIDTNATPNPSTDAIIMDEIIKQFAKLNYTRVDSIDHPSDVNIVVMASLIRVTNTSVGWYPGWGGWYGGWWGGWGWGGCCYGGVPVVTSYDSGTIFIDSFDGQSPPPPIEGALPPVVWTAGMNGVLSQSSVGQESRIRTVIAQAFAQSPYL